MLTNEQKEQIKATVPILREHGVALTSHFYRRMFTHNPELKNVFNQGNQHSLKQPTALALSVLAYAEHIDNPAVLTGALTTIGHKHVSLDIRPEQYAIVGRHLLASIGEVLGLASDSPLLGAWAAAYDQLAQLMTGVESKLYAQTIAKTGGWSGWRPFVIRSKVPESSEITSFYLYPGDGGTVADFAPGQYVSVRLYLPELGLFQPRQYSLSNAPNGAYYRISVKRETGAPRNPNGMVSNRLHDALREGDHIELTAPAGSFTLDPANNRPVVFVSGGVGQTPLLSMAESVVNSGSRRPIVWVHGARNPAAHAFRHTPAEWAQRGADVSTYYFYEQPGDAAPTTYAGRVDLSRLNGQVVRTDAEYYLCGPEPFLKKQYADLRAQGILAADIHYEEFGPHVLNLQTVAT